MTHLVPEIIPALLVQTPEEANAHWLQVLEAEHVQVDCLDGHFVPNISFFSPEAWPTRGPGIELHLMCQQPLAVMQAWEKHPLFRRAVWHLETPVHHEELVKWCRKRNIACGIALNPETEPERVAGLAKDLDLLLLLSVHPGWSGQPFLETTFAKIEAVRQRFPELPIGIDGGVTEALIPKLTQLGASHFYLGSALFATDGTSPRQTLHHLTQSAHHLSV